VHAASLEMTALRLITPPAIRPVSLTEAKSHLRVDFPDDDALIDILIRAATEYVDGPTGFLGRALISQTWELVLDAFPGHGVTGSTGLEIKIPIPPLISIVKVEYDDPTGLPVILDPADYTMDNVNEPGWIVPDGNWPATFDGINSVRIRFVAGYVDAANSPNDQIPGDIKAAILLTLGSLYANRETVVVGQIAVTLPWGAEALLRRKRIDLSMA
jgi:uncharacterized phiE125 gp8 family phage protein